MHFTLIDRVLERSETRLIALKQVSLAEEYLQDHFPGFPVLPGVMMIEALVQASRILLEPLSNDPRLVLGGVRALKYGSFVKPGESLRIEVTLLKALDDGTFDLKGEGTVHRAGSDQVAVAGRLTLRPVRMHVPEPLA